MDGIIASNSLSMSFQSKISLFVFEYSCKTLLKNVSLLTKQNAAASINRCITKVLVRVYFVQFPKITDIKNYPHKGNIWMQDQQQLPTDV